MILLIDNYDSFVYNLARYVHELGETPLVRRHDALTVDQVLDLGPTRIIISPGPCSPAEAGISTELVRRAGPTIPILGVCLGHQCIGAACGGEIVRAGRPMHGKTSRIHHDGSGLFTGLPSPFLATRYHSLVISPGSVPPELVVTARSEDGEIMAVRHRSHPVHGVQFHPESVLSEHGYRLIDHFLHGPKAEPRPGVPGGADGAPAPRSTEVASLSAAPPPVDLVR
jgi:anthranilate synthase/aminodeoxychorismate synthase-like glutamine amidotransferase